MRALLKHNPLFRKYEREIYRNCPQLKYQFSSNNTFETFKSVYNQNLEEFQKKMKDYEANFAQKVSNAKPTNKPYTHPYDMEHHRINFSGVKGEEYFGDVVGPEQVSPHYENFMVARKFAIIFGAYMLAANYWCSTVDLHWVMQSTYMPFVFWMATSYLWLEGRKSFFKFYSLLSQGHSL